MISLNHLEAAKAALLVSIGLSLFVYACVCLSSVVLIVSYWALFGLAGLTDAYGTLPIFFSFCLRSRPVIVLQTIDRKFHFIVALTTILHTDLEKLRTSKVTS